MKSQSKSISLAEVNASVETKLPGSKWKRIFAFFGPAYLVSVGYMDPGNWATDLAGGSKFGYTLLWVLLMSNLMALLLQSLSARLGIVRGRDLAQASRELYHPFTNMFLYILAEIAIAACDLAEVLGMAIGLQLLFHIPLTWGVTISVLDTFLLLFMLNFGIRKMEAFIIGLITIIGLAFVAELWYAQPVIGDVALGFIPSKLNDEALYIAIGIIGATVMPHNLYLHSSLVQTRIFERTPKSIWAAIRYNVIDSAIALNLALFVNAAILILAAAAFFSNGLFGVAEIQDAHKLLAPLLGAQYAPILFAIALIAAGQSSTITGTLAGQIVMEGYLNLRIQPWIRRLITRIIAIVPALICINYFGESYTGKLLIFSQVLLSMQLGFAVIPLIHFVSDKEKMGEFKIGAALKILAWLSALIIVSLNIKLVYAQTIEWLAIAGEYKYIVEFIVIPILIFAGIMLLTISLKPFISKAKQKQSTVPHGGFKEFELAISPAYKRIAIAIDFSAADEKTIEHALQSGGKQAVYLIIHAVETVGAMVMGKDIEDLETATDKANVKKYADYLISKGYQCESTIGYGNPKKVIPQFVKEFNAQLLVMGAHGHRGLKDMVFGTTVDAVRHAVNIPVLIVR
ncbi:MAG: Nramp family divalent metal transporter [Bacteroidia bacterium]